MLHDYNYIEKRLQITVLFFHSVVGMFWVMDSIPWVRCASGNVFYSTSQFLALPLQTCHQSWNNETTSLLPAKSLEIKTPLLQYLCFWVSPGNPWQHRTAVKMTRSGLPLELKQWTRDALGSNSPYMMFAGFCSDQDVSVLLLLKLFFRRYLFNVMDWPLISEFSNLLNFLTFLTFLIRRAHSLPIFRFKTAGINGMQSHIQRLQNGKVGFSSHKASTCKHTWLLSFCFIKFSL